eukprot:gnl/Dysnectes_brevis/1177_a1313_4602.p1 GENE.gnl/Dysnectes_brevis/1177_a1313_4602~~gnl/Dysnectes_brevis/1177_a1313_4602.p1  ORF type:complete len:279 (+),score=52.07 gnl/Dysnectes_brevis/1177_a1313_4602:28-837(+)
MATEVPDYVISTSYKGVVAEPASNAVAPLCAKCRYAASSPIALSCGGYLCMICKGEKTDVCPSCKKESCLRHNVGGYMASRFRDFEISCPYHEEGCTEKTNLMDIEAHLHVCPFSLVICPDCKKEIVRTNMATHLESECPKRSVKCELCSEDMLAEALPTHVRQKHHHCDACRQKFEKEDAGLHEEHKCPVPECDVMVRPCQLSQHFEAFPYQHADFLWRKLTETKEKLGATNTRIEELKVQHDTTRAALAEYDAKTKAEFAKKDTAEE